MAASLPPAEPPAHRRRARSGSCSNARSRTSERGEEAMPKRFYRAVLERDPHEFDALHMLGVLRYQTGDHDERDRAPAPRGIDVDPIVRPCAFEPRPGADGESARSPRRSPASIARSRWRRATSKRSTTAARCCRRNCATPRRCDASMRRLRMRPITRRSSATAATRCWSSRRHDEAARCFARLVDIAPDYPWAPGFLYQTRMLCCDWAGIDDARRERIDAAVRAGRRAIGALRLPGAVRLAGRPAAGCAGSSGRGAHGRTRARHAAGRPALPPRSHSPRLSLREFPRASVVAMLAAHLFETHDRPRFEVTGISLGPDTAIRCGAALRAHSIDFIDVRARTDARRRRVDPRARDRHRDRHDGLHATTAGPASLRSAPRRCKSIYPRLSRHPRHRPRSTILLADAHVIPPGAEQHYDRAHRAAPGHLLSRTTRRGRSATCARRAEAGLPERAFVFCCFNNNYKIMPETFDVWMRLLERVDGSVALAAGARRRGAAQPARRGGAARASIRRASCSRRGSRMADAPWHGIGSPTSSSTRIPTMRTRRPSMPCGAGLPVLTYPGSSAHRARRGGDSCRRSACRSSSRAIAPTTRRSHSRSPARPRVLRRACASKLAQHRTTYPLFDALRYRIAIEAAYAAMRARNEAGLPPAAFDVAAGGAIEVRE